MAPGNRRGRAARSCRRRFPTRFKTADLLHGDIFVPELGFFLDQTGHQGDAAFIVKHGDFDAVAFQKCNVAGKVFIFADHDALNAELNDGARAHHAGTERRVQRDGLVTAAPPGLAQAVHLAMRDRVALLNALVVACRQNLAMTAPIGKPPSS